MLSIIKNKIFKLIDIATGINFQYGDDGYGHIVVFEGNVNCNVVVVGEALGFYEKRDGRIFIGRSGSFLRSLLSNYVDISQLGFVNSIYYKPFKNKTPCNSSLLQHIQTFNHTMKIVCPKYSLVVGSIAKQCLKLSDFNFDHVFYIYHPAYYLRNKNSNVLDNMVLGINSIQNLVGNQDGTYVLIRKIC